MTTVSWKDKLQDHVPPQWAKEIDDFEAQIVLRKQGKIEEKVFAETRLRRGAYGQRYDNGQRHDGLATQKLSYPTLTKGPETFWDAPGMQRIKIPFGSLNPDQIRVLAELAEEYRTASRKISSSSSSCCCPAMPRAARSFLTATNSRPSARSSSNLPAWS